MENNDILVQVIKQVQRQKRDELGSHSIHEVISQKLVLAYVGQTGQPGKLGEDHTWDWFKYCSQWHEHPDGTYSYSDSIPALTIVDGSSQGRIIKPKKEGHDKYGFK
eukprot:g4597.t1